MALTTSTRSFIGKGKWRIAPKSAGAQSGPLLEVGNISAATFAITEDKKELKDFRSAGGGTKDTLSRIASVVGTMTVHDYSPENLAISVRASQTAVSAGAVAAEAHSNVFEGSFIPTNYIPDGTTAMVVTKLPSTTLVLDTDYTESPLGIQLLTVAEGGQVVDGDDITIGYTKNKSVVLEALVNSGLEYMLFFEGLNEVDNSNPLPISIHRVKFSPTAGLALIGDDFAGLELKFDVLSDSTVTGTGLSKFFKIGTVSN